MSDNLELEIANQLRAQQADNPTDLIGRLNEIWHAPNTELEARRQIAAFYLAAGYKSQLLQLLLEGCRQIVERDDPAHFQLPWGETAELIGSLQPSSKTIVAMIEGARAQDSLTDLLSSQALDQLNEQVVELRRQADQLAERQHEERRKQMLEQLEYLRSQRMHKEEGRVIESFSKIFPGDEQIAQIKHSFDERWAREILQNRVTAKTEMYTEPRLHQLEPEQQQVAKVIAEAVLAAAKAHRPMAYDLAIMLVFCEIFDEAQKVLAEVKSKPAKDWLRLEVFLRAGQYVEALAETHRLEGLYTTDPEVSFSIIYARARALHGLGSIENAKDLLQQILNLRPNYRLAEFLLKDWSKGSS